MNTFSILWVYVVFNIVAALALYYLVRMPKPKKENKKESSPNAAANATPADEPSRAGIHQGEKDTETARYASITGANTPPQQPTELSEKA